MKPLYPRIRIANFLPSSILIHIAVAQIGTVTQEITTFSAFPFQKPCAQSCFLQTGFCPNDILGSRIGCVEHTSCADSGWQASNDCYCRIDLQGAAQAYLTSCVKQKCTAGDAKIDQSTAGSIYEQYCAQKGYSIAAPATAQPSTTGISGVQTTKTSSGPVNTGISNSGNTPAADTGSKSSLSTTTIIGIVVGGVAGLACLGVVIKLLMKWCGGSRNNQPPQQQYPFQNQTAAYQYPQRPSYPMNLYPEQSWKHSPLGTESEVGPDDSVSVVSPPRVAPTLVSDVPMRR